MAGKKKNWKPLRICLAVLLIMAPAIIFAVLDKPVLMVTMLFASFISAVFINIDSFESFRAGEVEAKIKQVEKVIEEAHVTIDQLKEMTTPLLDYTLANVIADRKMFTGVAAPDKERFYAQILENVDKFDINSDNTSRLLDAVRAEVADNYIVEILNESDKWVGSDKNKSVSHFFNTYKVIYDHVDHSLPVRPIHIREFFMKDDSLYGDPVRKKIDQYESFFNKFFKE